MKISYNWLKQYIGIDLPAQTISEALTSVGLEVEDFTPFETVKGSLKGIVTGKVISCEKHPNADKLSLTTVDVGKPELLSIVCGAPNVAAGQKVLVATIGTMIYSGNDSFEIKKSKIRGEVSEGMICAEDELGLGTSHDGIMVLPESTETGMPASHYFPVEEDIIFEIGLTPNRSDAASHIGVARDLAAVLNFRAGKTIYTLKKPSVAGFNIDTNSLNIEVEVDEQQACPRYSGLTISNISVAPSPAWLKNRLLSIGVRPINNIVDITNYVLFETGQPLHAFDAKEIKGNKVIVKKLPADTPFVTLDGTERKLGADDLMICNETEGMCMAGVFGGLHSGVSDQTTAVFLESACFEAKTIRKTSKRHTLQTDASFRFERGSDPDITIYALQRAAGLIKEIAGGTISSDIKDVYPVPVIPAKVELTSGYLDKIAGQPIPFEQAKSILTDLDIKILSFDNEKMDLEIPNCKVDVYRPADVVEEILRVYGYDNIQIPEKLNASVNVSDGIDSDVMQHLISDMLSAKGFYEVMNNSLTRSAYTEVHPAFDPANNVVIINPLSKELDVMRQSLVFGGLETIAYNHNRKNFDLKLYEFGKIYRFDKPGLNSKNDLAPYNEWVCLDLFMSGNKQEEIWNINPVQVGFYDLKHEFEAILKRLNIDRKKVSIKEESDSLFEVALSYHLADHEIGRIGKLTQNTLKQLDVKKPVFYGTIHWTSLLKDIPVRPLQYEAVSKYPAVRRDLALVLDRNIRFEALKDLAFSTEKNLLQGVSIFDVYEGDKIPDTKKSYALGFVLLDKEKTLTDNVIEKTMLKLQKAFEQQFGAVLR
ncbi:MAG: phenylalanine--tRNA ligase subunit beta [Bacteroidales bacterium]|nr:phenylalanine--tRNA ligase subunit beta [Bacteroidales bacterium]